MKIRKEIKIGVVVTAALSLLIWGLNFLKGENILSNKQMFYAVYTQIDGLVEGNPVQVSGHKIGQVGKIFFHPDKSGLVVVNFVLDKETIKLPKDTRARIYSSDLLGSKAVQLVLGTDTSGYLSSGDTLISDLEANLQESVNATILPLKIKAEELISSMDSAVTIVQLILNEKARGDLEAGFESIKRSFATFESAATNLDDLIATNKGRITDIFVSIQSIASNLNDKNSELAKIIDNFAMISDTLAKANIAETLENASTALSQAARIMEKINNGEGTMGLLINNDSLYNNLESASLELDLLLKDINKRPKRYVHFSIFGKKDK